MKRGRKLKLNRKLIEEAKKLLEQGNYEKTVYEALRIGHETWSEWKRRGEVEKGTIFEEFVEMIKEAQAKAQALHLGVIVKAAASGNWTASAWFLERKFPEEWGRKDNKLLLETNKPVELVIKHVYPQNNSEEWSK